MENILSGTRVPNLVVLVMLGFKYLCTLGVHTLGYPATKSSCFGHAQVSTRIPLRVCQYRYTLQNPPLIFY